MGQDIMLASLLAVAAGFSALAIYSLLQVRRERSIRHAVKIAARNARASPVDANN